MTTTLEATTTTEPVTWKSHGAGSATVLGTSAGSELRDRQNWIIKLPDNWTDSQITELADAFPSEDKYVGRPGKGGLSVIIVWADQEQLSVALHAFPGAQYVEVDSELSATKEDFNAEFEPDKGKPDPVPWGLDRIDNEGELDGRYTAGGPDSGRGVHVYILDTGIRSTHGQFGGRAIPTMEIKNAKVMTCSSTDTNCALDRHGHGSHQAGVIGGTTVGVAPGSWLHAVKILSDTGQGTLSSFVMAMDWLLTNAERPAVIHAGLSASRGTGSSLIMKDTIDKAVARGIPVVVPAGQDNDNACHHFPSSVPSAITVGAIGADDKRSMFSGFGKCVDLFAPGSKIMTAGTRSDSAYAVLSSTSLAAAHGTGAAAMILAFSSPNSSSAAGVGKEMIDAAFTGTLKDVKGAPNKLLGIRWAALKPVVIGASEPQPQPQSLAGPAPCEAKREFRKKCVKAPAPGLLCPSNAGDYGQRLGFDRYRDQFNITVEGDQICAQRYDHEEDDFLPSNKYSASSFDDGGWTINLVILCHQKILAKTDKWLFSPFGDSADPSVCAASNPTDRSKLYYVLYNGVSQAEDCKKLCQLRYGCKGYSLNTDNQCEVWLKEINSYLRLPRDYPSVHNVSCNRFVGRGSPGAGGIRLAVSPKNCLQTVSGGLTVARCDGTAESQQFTWDGVGPIALTRSPSQCLTLNSSAGPIHLEPCITESPPAPSQTFAFEGFGTISWMDNTTQKRYCLETTSDAAVRISACDVHSPVMQFFY